MLTLDGRLTFVDPDRAPAPRVRTPIQTDRVPYEWGMTGRPTVVVVDDGKEDKAQ